MNASPTHDRWRRLWLLCGWVMIGLVILFSLIPAPPILDVSQGDKLLHLGGYALLMAWFAQVYRRPGSRMCVALGLTAFGITLEVLQGMTGWRSFESSDMVANTAGVLLGWLLAPPRGPELYRRVADRDRLAANAQSSAR